MILGYPLFAWMIYLAMFCTGGSVGPILLALEEIPLFTKCGWRYMSWMVVMIPMAYYDWHVTEDR